MVPLDCLDSVVCLEPREDQVFQDLQVLRVQMDSQERRENLDCQVCLDWKVAQDHQVVLDLRENLDARENLVLVSLDQEEMMVDLEGMVFLALREKVVFLDCQVHLERVWMVCVETLDLQGSRETRVPLDCLVVQDSLDLMEKREKRVDPAQLASLDRRERKEDLDWMECLVVKVTVVCLGHLDLLEQQEMMDPLDCLALLDLLDCLVPLVFLV